jgi:hypothetical protein
MSQPLVPPTIDAALLWATDHIDTWATVVGGGGASGANGLTPADITALQAALTAAEDNRLAAEAARTDSKTATNSQNAAMATLRDQLSIAISNIRAYAVKQADPNTVYAAMEIPPKADPTPAPAPTPPTSLQGELTNDGYALISWTATRTNGDYWSIWRQLSTGGGLVLIGTTAGKKFTDDSVPTGAAWAQYRVRSHRGDEMSESSEPAQIVFGVAAAA